ncbi:hypothetical protein BU14_0079s0010 [Porphyra umbilicalis]|uniref:Uncharacterized protein n=1 Tax=Porphyra umbilicalis TaxID=2786 RepID=A0A1X6PF49_PORUM|nr:hypothetical protein BU14_0079s0010 [Porphyra umbilicalis]|eukprot:OSX79366.1 hypothetical protein BU14_0079s0010 [Porphyra umbilicalis]
MHAWHHGPPSSRRILPFEPLLGTATPSPSCAHLSSRRSLCRLPLPLRSARLYGPPGASPPHRCPRTTNHRRFSYPVYTPSTVIPLLHDLIPVRCPCALDFDFLQAMGSVDTAAPAARDEYLEFFRSLRLTNNTKVAFLGRQLQTFYEIATTLDEHLNPTGAALHTAISRMCLPDNPLHAPHHRWIRVHDRLGFFSDEDEHSSRIVNVGLSYAYRHKELDAIADANALQLERLGLKAPLSGVGAPPDPSTPSCASGDETDVPIGGTFLRHALPGAVGGASTEADAGANGAVVVNTGEEDERDGTGNGDGYLDVPLGGSLLRSSAGATAHDGDDLVPEEGALIIARRTAGDASGGRTQPPNDPVVEVVAVARSSRVDSQPSLGPSTTAIRCIEEVLTSV